jgi:hypothetical protein
LIELIMYRAMAAVPPPRQPAITPPKSGLSGRGEAAAQAAPRAIIRLRVILCKPPVKADQVR